MGRIVFIDGRFVSEIEAKVSGFDRSFLYGDGLFETLSVYRSVPFRWEAHMERLGQGAKFLGLSVPLSPSELRRQAEVLIARNRMPEALLRLTVSRGVGRRGYSPRGADRPCIVMTLHPAPARDSVPEAGWKLATASVRLPAGDALARFKTCSKLAQVMARAEAEAAGADEALLLSTEGFVVEAASANLFWVRSGVVETAPMGAGILAGVTRSVVLELCRDLGVPCAEAQVKSRELVGAQAVFLSLSSHGIIPACVLDGLPIGRSPVVTRLTDAYRELLHRETSQNTA